MNWIKKIFLAAIFISILTIGVTKVSAQADPIAQGSAAVYDTQSYSNDIRQLSLQYRGELEEYRKIEKEYEILKQQYHQLGTLASLEKAVRATQDAMVIRAKVLKTYLRLIRFHLLSQTGIELPEKQAAEKNVIDVLEKLEIHRSELAEPIDKLELEKTVLDFEELIEEIESSAYRVLSLLAVGKLQTAHDKAIVLETDMQAQLATAGGALKLAERKRSFEETERLLGSLKDDFDFVEANFAKPSNSGYKNVYLKNSRSLNSIYSVLSRVLVYMKELLKT